MVLWYKTSQKYWLFENAIFGVILMSNIETQRRQIKHGI